MKDLNRVLAFAFLIIILACFTSNTAWAEENENEKIASITIDCSKDQMAYGEMIAQLNRAAEKNVLTESGSTDGGKRGQSTAYHAVLCRTDGREFSFESWNPLYIIAGPSNCYMLYFMSNTEAEKAVEELSSIEGIRYAELDAPVEACSEETSSFHSWGAERMSFGPYLLYTERCCTGSATVAVIDSGVFLHPLYADRVPESGYDYVEADNDATNDLYGHGTNVAGIVADCTNGFPVYLYPIRVLDASGDGKISNVVNAIREATAKGADIINLSLVSSKISEAMDEAIVDAIDAGVIVVAAAGNNSADTIHFSPAHLTYPGILVIGAAKSDGSIASYSNYGESVDLFAYGTNISCCSHDGSYVTATGTSIAAPHITALSALIALSHQEISPADVEMRINNSAEMQEAIGIPNLIRIIPDRYGFFLTELKMDLDYKLQLPIGIRPLSAMEMLTFESSDENVLAIVDGCMIPRGTGTATVTARCLGLEDCCFSVDITDDSCSYTMIPRNVESIESEAFFGAAGITHAVLPDGLKKIGPRAFDACENLKTIFIPTSVMTIEENSFSDAAVLCQEDSLAQSYAVEHGVQYIICE